MSKPVIDSFDSTEDGIEPIALVGMAARVPGAADIGEFWRNLAGGVESIRTYTREEQLAIGASEEELDDPAYVPAASVMDDMELFDAKVFGMTPRDARLTDPQHRLFLELSNTALEDAGYDPARYPGEIGVYAGTGDPTYLWRHIRGNQQVMKAVGALNISLSNLPDYVATTASYKLNLRGPSFTVHTACSTSLVALHLASESLRNGECDMAIAGGVCVELPYGLGYIYYDGGITSPDGHCRVFDAKAAGTLWGSGGGVVVLRRLSDAIADGDHIRAVILGNAINNDGSDKAAFSAPSAAGQSEAIAQALGVAGVDPRSVTYVEAHGTGTAVGDPIEVAGLSRGYGAGVEERGWCGIGSVKSNFGHLSQAAGVVGVIKTVLSMEHRQLPPTLHFENPNPAIDFAASPFYVNATLSQWSSDGPLRAGVSSFGIGGTNAHLVLEEPPAAAPAAAPSDNGQHLLRVSAATETALDAAVGRLAAHLREHPELDLASVAHTLGFGRAEREYRATVVATDAADAAAGLGDRRRLHKGTAVGKAPRVALLFSGQGAQFAGMGAELYRAEPAFAAAVDECAELLRGELDRDLRELLFATGDDRAAADEALRQTNYTQPALFVIEYALAKLWQSWGVEPAAMIGHSIGEYVAATLAGVFTLPDALRLVALRGRLMHSVAPGSMLAVRHDEAELLAELPDGLSLATVNGPRACVVAGETELIERYAAELSQRDVSNRQLRTSHAFHSQMMEPILAEFAAAVAAVPRREPTLPYLSNLTGDWVTGEQATDPEYWARHLRGTVRFGDCVKRLVDDGAWAMVECGPGQQLVGLARMQTSRDSFVPAPSLPGPNEKVDPLRTIYTAAGRLWGIGVALDDSFAPPAPRVPLPTYPYERALHWIEPQRESAAPAAAPVRRGAMPLDSWYHVPTWRQVAPLVEPGPAPRCLLFTDGSADALGRALRAAGSEVVEVRIGSEYAAGAHFVIRPAERDDYDRLLTDLSAAGGVPTRVVHAWATAGGAAGGDPEAAQRAQTRGLFSLLHFAQAIAAADLPDPVHLDVITRGAQDVVGGDLVAPEYATVAGVVKAAPLDLPAALTARHIDADPADSSDAAMTAVAAEILREPDADVLDGYPVAVRRGRRWIGAYDAVKVPGDAAATPAVRSGGVYLITGGLGGIGITLAEDLGTRGANVVLLGRSGLPARDEWDTYVAEHGTADRTGRAIATIRRIEAAGATVLVVTGDVTSAEDMRAVRQRIRETFRRLDGIVHSAGVAGGGLTQVRERADAERVLAPKMLGTLALRAAFGDVDLDFVVLCSSMTAIFGDLGQVDYTAANSFMDAYARSDHGWNARVVSLNWAGWLDTGMLVDTDAPDAYVAASNAITGKRRVDHPVLTTHTVDDDGSTRISGVLAPDSQWVLSEHRIAGVPVLPGTGHLELLRAAVTAAVPAPTDDSVVELRDVAFLKPLAVPDESSTRVVVTVAGSDGDLDVAISAGGDGDSNVTGSAAWVRPEPAAVQDLAAIRDRASEVTEVTEYDAGDSLVGFGAHWKSLRRVYRGPGEVLALLELPAEFRAEVERWGLHPSMLDEATTTGVGSATGTGSYLPMGYGRIMVRGSLPARFWSHTRAGRDDADGVQSADITLLDDDGRVLVEITDFTLRRVDPGAMAGSLQEEPTQQPTESAPEDLVGIHNADGVEAFHRLLAAPELGSQILVTARDLPDYRQRVRAVTVDAVAEELEPGDGATVARAVEGDYVAPRSEVEQTLAGVWAEVLGVDRVGVDDDFLDLGGNSLVAVQLIAQIRKALSVRLPLRSLFETSTVAGMATLVEKVRGEDGAGSSAGSAPGGAASAAASTDSPAGESAGLTIPRLARPE